MILKSANFIQKSEKNICSVVIIICTYVDIYYDRYSLLTYVRTYVRNILIKWYKRILLDRRVRPTVRTPPIVVISRYTILLCHIMVKILTSKFFTHAIISSTI